MGTASRQYVIGTAYVYNVEGFKVVKNVHNKTSKYAGGYGFVITGKNLKEAIVQDELNISLVNKENEKERLIDFNEIMKADTSRMVSLMTKNKKGFLHFMNHYQERGLEKAESFASTLKDFYSHKFDTVHDGEAVVKIMIKYGYSFTTYNEAYKLFKNF